MRLNFKKTEIENLVSITEAAEKCSVPYTGKGWNRPKETTPGLMLVGDSGVYFLSNADGQKIDQETKTLPLAYAEECNPQTMSQDLVYAVKSVAFGGDDGADFFPLEAIKNWIASSGADDLLTLDITPQRIQFLA